MNEPAFPRPAVLHYKPRISVHEDSQKGMSLRDYFAAKAMQGDWAAQDYERATYFDGEESDQTLIGKAAMYYRMADAMLKARDAKTPQTT